MNVLAKVALVASAVAGAGVQAHGGVILSSALRDVGNGGTLSSTSFGPYDQGASFFDSGSSGGTPFSYLFTTRQVSNITPDFLEYRGIGTITGSGPGPNGAGLRSLLNLVFDTTSVTPISLQYFSLSSPITVTINGSPLFANSVFVSPGRYTIVIQSFSSQNVNLRIDLPGPGAAATFGLAAVMATRRSRSAHSLAGAARR